MNRRLTITANNAGGFTTETAYQTVTGHWSVLSRTVTQAFPLVIVGRVADRDDYVIRVRAMGA